MVKCLRFLIYSKLSCTYHSDDLDNQITRILEAYTVFSDIIKIKIPLNDFNNEDL